MFSPIYLQNYKTNLKLAYPIMLGQAGHMVAGIVDSIMVGQISSVQLAGVSLANSVFILIFIIGIGFAHAVTPLVGIAKGAGLEKEAGKVYYNGLIANLSVGTFLTLLCVGSVFIFDYLNQSPEVLKYAVPYFEVISFSMLPYMLFLNGKQFLEGISDTKPAMVISFIGNGLNIVLNYFLIYGFLGMPGLESFGAAIATTIARTSMAVMMIFLIYNSNKYTVYIKNIKSFYNKVTIKKVFKIGIPIAAQHTLEVWAFAFGGIMAGWFGAYALAAHQIAMSLASLTFMAATGLAATATIRISNLLGEKKRRLLKIAGRSSFILVIAFMGIFALLFIVFSEQIASIFVTEPEVIKIAGSLIVITALFEIFDGTQAVGLGALRGLHDVKFPTIIAFSSYWIIMMPCAYLLSVTFQMGVAGIWIGYLIGLVFAASALYIRFERQAGKAIRETYGS